MRNSASDGFERNESRSSQESSLRDMTENAPLTGLMKHGKWSSDTPPRGRFGSTSWNQGVESGTASRWAIRE